MSEKGFRFALDDFVYSKDWDPLIEFAEIIKFDLTTTSFKENKTLIQAFKNKNIQFLAEKVETYKEYEAYKNVGCTLFQGYFFCKPEYIKGTSLSAHKLSRIRLLSLINQPEISFTQLEKIIEQDPNLTYLLLKYLNSAQFAFSNSIKSIRQAIVILGIDNIKKWSTLVTLRNILSKPTELLRLSLVRARQAELIAIDNKQSDANSFFLCGLVSVLDALLDTPFDLIFKLIPLNAHFRQALLTHEGDIGQTLELICQYELNQQDRDHSISRNYLMSCQWADQVMESL